MERPWFLYLIECANGGIYTGVTVDVVARYSRHALGRGARYTRANPPRRLLAVMPCGSRGDALRAEYRVRRWRVEDKRRLAREHPPSEEVLAQLDAETGNSA